MGVKFMKHLMGCQRKGRDAALRGDSREACPYVCSKWDNSTRNLLKQRQQYWLHGYDTAKENENA